MIVFLVMVMIFDLLNSIFQAFVLMQSIEILVLPFVNDRPMSVIPTRSTPWQRRKTLSYNILWLGLHHTTVRKYQ